MVPLAFALASAGCDCVPCPGGYVCSSGRCVVDPNAPPAADLAEAPPDDLTVPVPVDMTVVVTNDDMPAAPADLRPPVRDMTRPREEDLAKGCVGKGGSCYYHKDSVCCSHYCVYETNDCR